MLINCEKKLKNKRITNEIKKDNATHIAITTTMLTIICSIKYRTIVVVLLSYLIKFTKKNLFILLHKMLRIIRSSLLT